MSRGRRLIVLLSLIALLFALAAVGAWWLGAAPRPTPDLPERAANENPIATPSVPTGALGSGATFSSAWYQLYFTAPSYPDVAANHRGGLDTYLVDLMDRATRTIDVADYDFDLADVADAMARAAERGVRVRMVTETDTLTNKNPAVQAAFATLRRARIPIVDDRRPALMHDKFTVVDGEWVSTGSWNYTDGDTYRLNNNMIIIDSQALAENYTVEFERMFVKHEFGSDQGQAVPNPTLTIGGARVQNCFSPGGNCASLIVKAVNGARQSIRFLAFSFTYDGIGQAMVNRAKAGVSVQGVFETTGSQTSYSEYGKLKRAGLEVYADGNPWSMHHKVIIIDDRIVVFGSFNFSESADKSNNENLLIIDDPELARAFTVEYDKVLAIARNPPVRK